MQNLRNLFNQSLTAIGHEPTIVDPEESAKAAVMCRLWYPPARRAVMSAFHWSSIRVMGRPPRVSEREDASWQPGDPAPGYRYTHSLPVNCLQPQYLSDFSRFLLGRRGTARVMYSNVEHPILYYTMDCPSPELWDVNLYTSVVYSLAASLNMSFSGKYQLTQALEERVNALIGEAMVADANSDDEYFESIPTTLHGTGFSPHTGTPNYIHPTTSFRVAGIAA